MISSITFGHGMRTSYLDRGWLNHWTVIAIFPITPPDTVELRTKMLDFLTSDPTHPLCCTLEDHGRRWRPVTPENRQRYVEQLIVRDERFDHSDPVRYLNSHRPAPDATAPFKVVIGLESMCFYFAHACGDGTVFSPFSVLMTLGEVESCRALRSNADMADAGKLLLNNLRPHWREWRRYMRSGITSPPRPAAPATVPAAVESSTDAAVMLLSADEFEDFKAWRKVRRPGESLTSLMASAAYRALAGQRIPMNGQGFYTLIDVRRYLPKEDALRPGNLAKSMYLAADMNDPTDIATAMTQLVGSARAVPALFSGGLSARSGGGAAPALRVGEQPITMTFNSMMRNYGVERLPWTHPDDARYVVMSYPVGANGISVFACSVAGRIAISASFDTGAVDRQAVALALAELRDMPAVLEGSAPEPASLSTRRTPTMGRTRASNADGRRMPTSNN